jgi:hypothetical protein
MKRFDTKLIWRFRKGLKSICPDHTPGMLVMTLCGRLRGNSSGLGERSFVKGHRFQWGTTAADSRETGSQAASRVDFYTHSSATVGDRRMAPGWKTEYGIDHIPNVELELDRIPDSTADWHAISRFALTFDGYTVSGSFERCAEIANNHCCSTLTDLRTCLFFEQRRWRHFADDPDPRAMVYIHEVVRNIREKVASRNLA